MFLKNFEGKDVFTELKYKQSQFESKQKGRKIFFTRKHPLIAHIKILEFQTF